MTMNVSRAGRWIFGWLARRRERRKIRLFISNVTQYLTYNIPRWRAARRDDKQQGGECDGVCVHRVFCLRVFFCRVYVQLRVENAVGSCKCASAQCATIAGRVFIYAIRYSIFHRDCLFLPLVRGERTRGEASLPRETMGKEAGLRAQRQENEKEKWKDSHWQARFIDRARRDRYALSRHPTRVARGNTTELHFVITPSRVDTSASYFVIHRSFLQKAQFCRPIFARASMSDRKLVHSRCRFALSAGNGHSESLRLTFSCECQSEPIQKIRYFRKQGDDCVFEGDTLRLVHIYIYY